MRFPGKRKSTHYFPVDDQKRVNFSFSNSNNNSAFIVGIDQLLVDIEIEVTDEILLRYQIPKGESVVLSDQLIDQIYSEMKKENRVKGEYAGGAIGNTLHNFSVLSDERSVLLGSICKNINVGDYAFKYVATTSALVDLSYLYPANGPMARALSLITPDGERSFAIGKGIMNDYPKSQLPQELIKKSVCLVLTTFLLRDKNAPLYETTMKAIEIAKNFNIPVVLTLGTSFLIKEDVTYWQNFIKEHVNIVAMNDQEAIALTGKRDYLLALEEVLDLCDATLLTVGPKGLYFAGHCDKEFLRKTKDMIHSKSVPEYNRYEYSRPMLKELCREPQKIYTHLNPFLGGPKEIKNTNGAGDGALSALLHDMAANLYHAQTVPNSPKHRNKFLTYSSLHQVGKYANRVSFEILISNSPRLNHGLPEREAALENSYWAK